MALAILPHKDANQALLKTGSVSQPIMVVMLRVKYPCYQYSDMMTQILFSIVIS